MKIRPKLILSGCVNIRLGSLSTRFTPTAERTKELCTWTGMLTCLNWQKAAVKKHILQKAIEKFPTVKIFQERITSKIWLKIGSIYLLHPACTPSSHEAYFKKKKKDDLTFFHYYGPFGFLGISRLLSIMLWNSTENKSWRWDLLLIRSSLMRCTTIPSIISVTAHELWVDCGYTSPLICVIFYLHQNCVRHIRSLVCLCSVKDHTYLRKCCVLHNDI